MKYLLMILPAIVVLYACGNNAPPAANEKLVRQLFERFNKHDWTGMAALYAPTAAFKDPSLGKDIVQQTRQQTIEKYTALSQTFPDIKDSVTAIYASGDKHIIAEFISVGTTPDGGKFLLPICTIFTIEQGVITKDFTYYDNSGQ
jgi:ketosteroid isomerase-like protein